MTLRIFPCCSPLLWSVHSRVCREIVPFRSWLLMRRADPCRSLLRPAPLFTPLSLRHWVVWIVSDRVVSILSQTRARSVADLGGDDWFVVWPARASACSFPRTPELPGQKIHRTVWRSLWLMATNQSAWSMPVEILVRVLLESERQTNRVMFWCLTHSSISVIALTSMPMDEVVIGTNPWVFMDHFAVQTFRVTLSRPHASLNRAICVDNHVVYQSILIKKRLNFKAASSVHSRHSRPIMAMTWVKQSSLTGCNITIL